VLSVVAPLKVGMGPALLANFRLARKDSPGINHLALQHVSDEDESFMAILDT
jgi:hypothetical protein